jgi:hypothetical protein
MAFEYLMAFYMLTGQLDKLVCMTFRYHWNITITILVVCFSPVLFAAMTRYSS